MSNAGSLDGFRVIDLTQGLCGPFCTMQLGDAGAEVIKIESPAGDFARRMGPPFVAAESAVFLSLNRNKKSVVLDLETSSGRAAAARLAHAADVLVADFVPGAADGFGLAYDQLRAANPRLVYCSITPFGENGPLCHSPGAELVIQAMAEYTASLGQIGDPPVRVGADIASLNTGIFAAQAILAALFHRLRSGEGQRVAVSELGSMLHMRGIMWTSMSDPDDWYGFHLDHYTKPPDHGYRTKNGSLYFILRRGGSEDWDRLIMELGMEEVLADPRFADYGRAATSIGRYATEVKPIWEKAFANRTREELIDLIKSVGGDAVPIMDYPSLIAHPQTAALEAIAEVDHPAAGRFNTVRPVARFSDTPDAIRIPPPALGQHTEEVLRAAGIAPSRFNT
ncbi:MAG: CoA transferase [Candidatus Binataceae bacterium]|nr:CoA transferase [Candidatus Binataceae bacterium]